MPSMPRPHRRSAVWSAVISGALAFAVPSLAAQADRLYVTNQDDATVSIINLRTRAVESTLDLQALGFGPNAKPHHVQVEPDGSYWYLTLIGAGKVLKLDREQHIVGSIDLEVPGLLSLHPAQDLLFVGRSMSAVNPPARVAVIRRSDFTLLDEIDVFFPRPHALIAHPGGLRLYTASLGVNQLATVDVAPDGSGEVRLTEIPGQPGAFVQLALSPDARWLALTAPGTAQVHVFDLADPAAPKLAHSITTPAGPFEPAFSPDGRELWVTDLDANAVTVIETADWTVAATITDSVFAQPHGIAFAPGGIVWVGNRHQHGGAHDHEGGKPTGAGTAVAICAATRKVVAVVPVGAYAAGMSLATPPHGATSDTSPACR